MMIGMINLLLPMAIQSEDAGLLANFGFVIGENILYTAINVQCVDKGRVAKREPHSIRLGSADQIM